MTIQVMATDIMSSSCYASAEIHLDEICDDGYGLGSSDPLILVV